MKIIMSHNKALREDLPGMEFVPGGARAKWVCYVSARLYRVEDANSLLCDCRGVAYDTGWNGSYHACWFSPYIIGWGRSPSRARKRANAALAALKSLPVRDSAAERFAARQAIRSGD